jgi:hypothetical protein
VMFFTLLEYFYLVWLAVKDRDKTHRITSVILIRFLFLVLPLRKTGTNTAGESRAGIDCLPSYIDKSLVWFNEYVKAALVCRFLLDGGHYLLDRGH